VTEDFRFVSTDHQYLDIVKQVFGIQRVSLPNDKGCIQMGSIMADLDLMLDLSPVDYNSRAILFIEAKGH